MSTPTDNHDNADALKGSNEHSQDEPQNSPGHTKDLKITTHKHSPTKVDSKMAPMAPMSKMTQGSQAFDIIPRSQFRPTVTARPVLTPTQPEQADNTLQTASQAASSQLTHRALSFNTASAPELPDSNGSDGNAEALLDRVTSLTAEKAVKDSHNMSEISKDKADDLSDIDNTKAEGTDDGIIKNEHDVALQSTENAEDAEHGEDIAAKASGAAEVGQDHPITTKSEVSATAVKDKTVIEEPAVGSIDHIFKQNEEQPLEHSQALKDELQSMDGKEAEEAEAGEPGEARPHHDLYGGKPVIVIHKAQGAQATLNQVLWLIFCLLLALVIVDGLLDARVITTNYNVPHTHLF